MSRGVCLSVCLLLAEPHAGGARGGRPHLQQWQCNVRTGSSCVALHQPTRAPTKAAAAVAVVVQCISWQQLCCTSPANMHSDMMHLTSTAVGRPGASWSDVWSPLVQVHMCCLGCPKSFVGSLQDIEQHICNNVTLTVASITRSWRRQQEAVLIHVIAAAKRSTPSLAAGWLVFVCAYWKPSQVAPLHIMC